MNQSVMKTGLHQEGTPLRILITGGTFDKQYDPLRGELGFADSFLPEILRYSRCTLPVTLDLVQMKDSLYMTDEDRLHIRRSCTASPEEHIIITHGTDTMVETAQLIGQAQLGKRIVLTGAMVPYSVNGSDSVFNLGCSIAAVQFCPPGVWICMNGRLYPHDGVRKNLELGVFELTGAES